VTLGPDGVEARHEKGGLLVRREKTQLGAKRQQCLLRMQLQLLLLVLQTGDGEHVPICLFNIIYYFNSCK